MAPTSSDQGTIVGYLLKLIIKINCSSFRMTCVGQHTLLSLPFFSVFFFLSPHPPTFAILLGSSAGPKFINNFHCLFTLSLSCGIHIHMKCLLLSNYFYLIITTQYSFRLTASYIIISISKEKTVQMFLANDSKSPLGLSSGNFN